MNSDQATPLLLLSAWIVALVATLGALFIGEVMGREPCFLCWHQRIFMFPLAVILAVACFRADFGVWRYALPLAAAGFAIAAYHTALYAGVIDAGITPCGRGPSCAGADMTLLGWVPIPALSLAAFGTITLLLFILRGRSSQ